MRRHPSGRIAGLAGIGAAGASAAAVHPRALGGHDARQDGQGGADRGRGDLLAEQERGPAEGEDRLVLRLSVSGAPAADLEEGVRRLASVLPAV